MNERRGERLALLTQTSAGSDMGRLLRRFWQPVALSRQVAEGKARPVRILGEELTVYRGANGEAHLVGARCAHRRTVLHTGWIEGDEIRCMYHGWKFDASGQCTERPAERDAGLPNVRIPAYPVHEYCGFIFAYLGKGPAPAFELPRKDAFEQAGAIVVARVEIWPCNWLQLVENSLDAVHVSFVHQKGRIGTFGQLITEAVPELEYVETEAGIRQIAMRGADNVRVSDWTFPNNNHIKVPGQLKSDPWVDVAVWNVPVDDVTVARFLLRVAPSTAPDVDARLRAYFESCMEYNAADHHDELFNEEKYPADEVVQLTSAQDYVAQMGQGPIADREHEILGRSDAGIALLRRIFFREMEAIREGRPTKPWRKLEHSTELPIRVA